MAKTKTLDSYSDELIQGLASETITALLDFRFPLLRTKIEEQSEKNPDNAVLLYLLINEVLETVSGDEYINVQYYLAQDILIKAFKNNFDEIEE